VVAESAALTLCMGMEENNANETAAKDDSRQPRAFGAIVKISGISGPSHKDPKARAPDKGNKERVEGGEDCRAPRAR